MSRSERGEVQPVLVDAEMSGGSTASPSDLRPSVPPEPIDAQSWPAGALPRSDSLVAPNLYQHRCSLVTGRLKGRELKGHAGGMYRLRLGLWWSMLGGSRVTLVAYNGWRGSRERDRLSQILLDQSANAKGRAKACGVVLFSEVDSCIVMLVYV